MCSDAEAEAFMQDLQHSLHNMKMCGDSAALLRMLRARLDFWSGHVRVRRARVAGVAPGTSASGGALHERRVFGTSPQRCASWVRVTSLRFQAGSSLVHCEGRPGRLSIPTADNLPLVRHS